MIRLSKVILCKVAVPLCAFCAVTVVRSPARTTPSWASLTQADRALQTTPANALCNADKSVCLPRMTQNMLVTNPLKLAVTAAGSVSDITWELDDQTQKLAAGRASDDPNWSGSTNPSSPEAFQLSSYVFVLPKSANGVLKLSPVRNDRRGMPSALPALDIPVRFGTATSTLMVTVPKDYDQYQNEADEWASTSGPPAHFAPKSPFIQEQLTILHVNDVVFASAEVAAEKASVLSQAPVRILNFAVRGATAYVDLSLNELQDHWAGFSITLAKVETLVEEDLLQFPNIHKVVFGWPPGKTDSSVSLLTLAGPRYPPEVPLFPAHNFDNSIRRMRI
jgi:hypothetical protein